jgi:hypothetical protein
MEAHVTTRATEAIAQRLIKRAPIGTWSSSCQVTGFPTYPAQLPSCSSCRSNDLLAPSQVGAADDLILRWDQYREESIGPPTDRKQLSTERIRGQQLLPA